MSIITTSRVTVTATIELDESQIRALVALAGYGDDAFIKAFYRECGRVYLEPHERGLIRLFDNIRKVCGPAIGKVEKARKALEEPEPSP